MKYLFDPQNKLSFLCDALNIKPFKETIILYLVQNKTNEKNFDNIYEVIQIEDQFALSDKLSITVSPRVILASIKLAEKTNSCLLFAHTHPPSDSFPKEYQVYSDAGFSFQDMQFNSLINNLLCKKNFLSKPVYYLVMNSSSYCAIMFYKGKYVDVTIPTLSCLNFRKSSWEINGDVFSEKQV